MQFEDWEILPTESLFLLNEINLILYNTELNCFENKSIPVPPVPTILNLRRSVKTGWPSARVEFKNIIGMKSFKLPAIY